MGCIKGNSPLELGSVKAHFGTELRCWCIGIIDLLYANHPLSIFDEVFGPVSHALLQERLAIRVGSDATV